MHEEKAKYISGYKNPSCKCRAVGDCSKGKVNADGLCKNCASMYPKKK